jgi:hypothetical protein
MMKLIHSLMRRVQVALARLEVTVLWCGRLFSHAATSWADALEWMACYPSDAIARVWQDGKLLAVRG